MTSDQVWQKQELLSPRVPIVRTFSKADGLGIVEEALAVADVPKSRQPTRNDMIFVRVTNTGKEARTLQPKLIVDTALGLTRQGQCLLVGKHEAVTSSLKMTGQPAGRQVPLDKLTVAPGKTEAFFVVYSSGGPAAAYPTTMAQAQARANTPSGTGTMLRSLTAASRCRMPASRA